jgi:hypothetical protein
VPLFTVESLGWQHIPYRAGLPGQPRVCKGIGGLRRAREQLCRLSPAQLWPTSGCKPTPRVRWCSSSRRPAATTPRTWCCRRWSSCNAGGSGATTTTVVAKDCFVAVNLGSRMPGFGSPAGLARRALADGNQSQAVVQVGPGGGRECSARSRWRVPGIWRPGFTICGAGKPLVV